MPHSPPFKIRVLFASLIFILCSIGIFGLSLQLKGQLHIRNARQYEISSQYRSATEEFHKAAPYLPDNHFINYSLGNIYYRMSGLASDSSERSILYNKAKLHFVRALALNPLDARSAYGLARVEIRLEQHEVLAGARDADGAETNVLPALEKAIELRPASTIYRLTLARYLYLHNEHERLLSEVRMLGRLQPSNLGRMQREPFWSVAARNAFLLGVQEALAAGITPRQALFTLSEIKSEEKDWLAAISYRIEGMAVQPSLNTAADYIRLGSLYVIAGESAPALEDFFLALDYSTDIENDIIAIMRSCRKANDPQTLIDFYLKAHEIYGNSTRMDISAARFLVEMLDLENAKRILFKSNARQPNAEAYYMLAQIAEKKQAWDEMELSIQKAVMYDPENSRYHLVFSQVLNRLQKYERAEKEAGLALQNIDNGSAGLYHYRATLRVRINDYEGALEDWLQAVTVDSGNASFYFQAGDVSEKMGRIDEAAEYFQKAIELAPGNKTYVQRLERLDKKYGVKR
jgi:tetratricopeptide (TPR) repeat protein